MLGKKNLSVLFCFLLCCCVLTLFSQNTFAEPTYDRHDDLIPMNSQENRGVVDQLFAEDSGELFLIIDDSHYLLDEHVIFRTSDGKRTTLDAFQPGTEIAFYAVGLVVSKIWLPAPDTVEQVDKGNGTKKVNDQTIKEVDGVWVN
ncbi:MAG: hypothetical protein GY702_25095 [Desulfobulbaceae bacterium]|nr:hypothetical protein [Desulfobulbaceae bacterium]